MKLTMVTFVMIPWFMVLVSCQTSIDATHCQGTECQIDPNTNERAIALLENATITIANTLPKLMQVLEDHLSGSGNVENGSCDQSNSDETVKVRYPNDCKEVATRGNTTSGYYTIQPVSPKPVYKMDHTQDEPVDVYCDMDTDDGGWTVFQRRHNGVVGFNRDWDAYKHGFGYLNGDFWMGLDLLHKMTALGEHELRVDLQDFSDNRAYAQYDYFAVGDEESFYILIVGEYEGTAGDGLSHHNGNPFSTKDQDHDNDSDRNCAVIYKGAWWYTNCLVSDLNGLYMGPSRISSSGMAWKAWKNNWEVLKTSEMKVRPMN